jgi:hypothetical protein
MVAESFNPSDDGGDWEIPQTNTEISALNDTNSPENRSSREQATANEMQMAGDNAGSDTAPGRETTNSSEMTENDPEPSRPGHDGNNASERLNLDAQNFAEERIAREIRHSTDPRKMSADKARAKEIEMAGENPGSDGAAGCETRNSSDITNNEPETWHGDETNNSSESFILDAGNSAEVGMPSEIRHWTDPWKKSHVARASILNFTGSERALSVRKKGEDSSKYEDGATAKENNTSVGLANILDNSMRPETSFADFPGLNVTRNKGEKAPAIEKMSCETAKSLESCSTTDCQRNIVPRAT